MGSKLLSTCAERDRLLNDLTDAAHEFALQAEELRVSDTRFGSIRDALQTSRQRAEQAHAAYFAHREKHGC
jgi:hypothetical protein